MTATKNTVSSHPLVDASASPLSAVLPFAALNSLTTGAVMCAISTITQQAYAFGVDTNYFLGVEMGVAYIAGAMFAGPVIRRACARFPSLTMRRVLAFVMFGSAAACAIPAIPGIGPLAAWLFMAIYTPLAGALWPIVESYVSGGRHGEALRGSIGRFNVTWSAAAAIGLVVMAPFQKDAPLFSLYLFGALHIVSLVFLRGFHAEPGRHDVETHAVPAIYPRLLRCHRALLVTTYVVMYALNPYLPHLLATSFAISPAWITPTVAIYHAMRFVTFGTMERWHGWHGHFATAVVGALLLLVGFAGCLSSPLVHSATGSWPLGFATLVGGLLAFGAGAAALYTAALYYAMAVGAAEVDAGGTHEALIGVGYLAGPACGLLGGVAATAASRDEATLGIVTLGALIGVGFAWRAARVSGLDARGA